MPDLDFQVESALAEQYAAAPTLIFKTKITQSDGSDPIHAIALRCQIRLEPARRHYTAEQKSALSELFGAPALWGQSLRPMLWTHISTIVPAFTGSTVTDLPVPCTYDFNLATTKYFDAINNDGDLPLCFLFSGTVFYHSKDAALQTAPISWSKESDFRLPAATWRDMMDRYYPNTAFLAINKDLFEKLRQFKLQSGHMAWDQALENLLQSAEQRIPG